MLCVTLECDMSSSQHIARYLTTSIKVVWCDDEWFGSYHVSWESCQGSCNQTVLFSFPLFILVLLDHEWTERFGSKSLCLKLLKVEDLPADTFLLPWKWLDQHHVVSWQIVTCQLTQLRAQTTCWMEKPTSGDYILYNKLSLEKNFILCHSLLKSFI